MHILKAFFCAVFLVSIVFGEATPSKSQEPPMPGGLPSPTHASQQDALLEKSESENGINRATVFATIDLEFQVAAKRSEIADLLKLDTLIDSFLKNKESIRQAVDHAVDHAKSIDCSKDFAVLGDDYDNVLKAISFYWPVTSELQKAEGQTFPPILGNFFMAAANEKCKLLQLEDQRKSTEAAITQLEQVDRVHKPKLNQLKSDLLYLQDKLQKAVSSEGAIQVAKNLPVLILIIAGASIAIILVVRLFAAEL